MSVRVYRAHQKRVSLGFPACGNDQLTSEMIRSWSEMCFVITLSGNRRYYFGSDLLSMTNRLPRHRNLPQILFVSDGGAPRPFIIFGTCGSHSQSLDCFTEMCSKMVLRTLSTGSAEYYISKEKLWGFSLVSRQL